jgi:hypothetical protein
MKTTSYGSRRNARFCGRKFSGNCFPGDCGYGGHIYEGGESSGRFLLGFTNLRSVGGLTNDI